ncbi:hypothetical protein GQ597_01565 [Gilliamella sp. Pra-s65]|uniref:hypothetical protein n=1 Tax=unclassified Gilliamella TaxID=2685620 RepID=UPI001365892C|nr:MULTISPECIES: hypothetical protein [unclassified Gilliamella]MWN89405.1 hypothetical protein [Gilliamella sp. Pra-s65]MWP47504.1 hypothetical protein [Gilliamella sp. Pas-s27]MWP72448.1 hypothetical protein [Gilliamella sp. Pra-s52]
MKGLKLAVVAILMSLALFGCDNSKSDANQVVGDSSKNTDLAILQDTIINEAKKMLPVKVDAKTNLVEIAKDSELLNYKYIINASRDEISISDLVEIAKASELLNYKYIINASKDEISISDTKNQTGGALRKIYCGNNPQIKQFRDAFPNGVSHNYYIGNEKVMSFEVKPSDCDTK